MHTLDILMEHGVDYYLEKCIYTGRPTLEELNNYCTNLNVDLKELYYKGYNWNEIDVYRGDITSLLPYVIFMISKRREKDKEFNVIALIDKITYNKQVRGYLYERCI